MDGCDFDFVDYLLGQADIFNLYSSAKLEHSGAVF